MALPIVNAFNTTDGKVDDVKTNYEGSCWTYGNVETYWKQIKGITAGYSIVELKDEIITLIGVLGAETYSTTLSHCAALGIDLTDITDTVNVMEKYAEIITTVAGAESSTVFTHTDTHLDEINNESPPFSCATLESKLLHIRDELLAKINIMKYVDPVLEDALITMNDLLKGIADALGVIYSFFGCYDDIFNKFNTSNMRTVLTEVAPDLDDALDAINSTSGTTQERIADAKEKLATASYNDFDARMTTVKGDLADALTEFMGHIP